MNILIPFNKILKIQEAITKITIKKEQKQKNIQEEKEVSEQIQNVLNNWKQYHEQLQLVVDEELISYYLYMIKAEEARLSYLQRIMSENNREEIL